LGIGYLIGLVGVVVFIFPSNLREIRLFGVFFGVGLSDGLQKVVTEIEKFLIWAEFNYLYRT
jgi:hypothetical protein